jgi:molybdopterin/thiamine biosynthesis adenylyltransferase
VAAKFVEQRVKGVSITPHNCKIQDKDESFYMQFTIVICGLDSIEARRWINSTLVNMVEGDDFDTMKPLIDGGTEGTVLLKNCGDYKSTYSRTRVQGPVKGHISNTNFLHRVSIRHACSKSSCTTVHFSINTSPTRALH